MKHRYSGWPGAYCIWCGSGDPAEECLAIHDAIDFICSICKESWPQDKCINGRDHLVIQTKCLEHPIDEECPVHPEPYVGSEIENKDLSILIGAMFK